MLMLLFVGYYLGDDGQVAYFPSYMGTLALLALWVISPGDWRLLIHRRSLPALAFITYLAASGLWSEPADFLPLGHAVLLAGFLFGILVVHHRLPGLLAHAIDLLILVAALSAAISIYLFHTVDYNPLDETDRLYAFGRIYNPVISAMSYAIPLVFALTRLAFEQSRLRQLLLAAATLALVWAIVLTGTRSVWLGLFAAPLAIVMINPALTPRRRWIALAAIVAGAGVLLGIAFAMGLGDNILRRALSFRPEIWTAMLERIQAGNWLIGQGIGSDSSVTWQHLTFDHAHSVYLATLFYGGAIGLTLLVAVMLTSLLDLLGSRFDQRTALVTGGIAFALVSLGIDGNRLLEKVDHLWIVFWLPVALGWTSRPRDDGLD
ncbi:MAG: O-antigen ligase family protein [Pseudomonadota bacterium]